MIERRLGHMYPYVATASFADRDLSGVGPTVTQSRNFPPDESSELYLRCDLCIHGYGK